MGEEILKLHGDIKIPFHLIAKRMFKYAKEGWVYYLIAFFLMLLYVSMNVVLPLILKQLISMLDEGEILNYTLRVLLGVCVGYFLIWIFNQCCNCIMSILLRKAGEKVVYRLRLEVFTHIERMSLDQFNAMPIGSLVTRVCNYTYSVSDFFSIVLVNLIAQCLTFFGVLGIMFYLSWQLSLLMIAIGIVVGIMSFFFGKETHRMFRRERKALSNTNTFISESLAGMRITQIFNQEEKKKAQFELQNTALFKAQYHVNVVFTFYRPVVEFIKYSAVALTFFVGYKTGMLAATIVAFYLYISKFFEPVQSLADNLTSIQSALTSVERLFNLLDVEPQVLDLPNAISKKHFEGRIEFDHVWFAYEKENWILKDVSFVIDAKKTAAFVGPTGAGKTTILSLITRNYTPQKGRILIDGIDIASLRMDDLRKAIGQMLQDVFLFSGTIKDNITLYDERFTNEQVMNACQYVNANTFIDKMPKGVMEEVSEGGANFSSGQRQLLSFARTVIHEPEILILDEATANIDTETELVIQDSLEKMRSIGTMLIVAHRLSTIQKSDIIFVIKDGRIIESGNHQSLLKQKGYYFNLFELQFEKAE